MGALLRAIRRRPLKHAAAHVYYIGHLLALAGYSLDCSNDEIKWNARAFGSVNDEPRWCRFNISRPPLRWRYTRLWGDSQMLNRTGIHAVSH